MVERLRTLSVEPPKGSLSVEHLKVLMVEHLKVMAASRACFRILMVEPMAALLVERATHPAGPRLFLSCL